MKVETVCASSIEVLEVQIRRCRQEDFHPTLALVFSPITFDLKAVSALFDDFDIDLYGCSTAGEILNDEVFDGALVGMLLDLDRQAYSVFHSDYCAKNPFHVSKLAGNFARERFANPALIVASGGVTVDAEQIVYGLKAGIGGEAPIFGGLAGDDLQVKKTLAFSREGVTENGIVALVLDHDKVEIKGLATSGWEAVGMENVITHAEGNVVYTINNEPALDVFTKYFGYFDNSEIGGRNLSTISAQYPFQILREDGTTVLRSPLVGSENEKTLVLAGGVRQGDRFRFSISPGFEVIDQTIADFGDLQRRTGEVDALILFSCKGRHAALGPLIEDEIKGIFNHWQKPLIGFFTYGEIGPTKNGVCEFHNETCSLVALKER